MEFVLEACVDSAASAEAAARGGATRLELCGHLPLGGVSPAETLFELVRERVGLPIRVLLRPRCGDFLYTADEFELLQRQVRRFAALGADGIVIGVLRADGTLDEARMAELIALAPGCGITLHRAFDLCRDPFAALDTARRLGVDTILTSGQCARCADGAALLRQLAEKSAGRPQILAGAGVDAAVIRRLWTESGVRAFHLSGSRTEDSPMTFRRAGVPMGLPGFSEYERRRCDETRIRAARQTLDTLCGA